VYATAGHGGQQFFRAVPSTLPIGAFSNGSFETGVFAPWTTTGNIEIGSIYGATGGTNSVIFNRGNLAPNAVLSQTFTTTPGHTYVVQFHFGAVDSGSPGQQAIHVTLHGTTDLASRDISVLSTNPLPTFSTTNFSFVADSSTCTLRIEDVSTVTFAIDGVLDNVFVVDATP
jgi:hypothetical protein